MIELSRWISWRASPRLFTSSMLRSDSVVEPASAVVSATITFWIFLIRFESTRAEDAEQGHGEQEDRRDDPVHGGGVDHHEDRRPTSVVNSVLTAMAISFSTSARTFWSLPSVSPLRWSSNRE